MLVFTLLLALSCDSQNDDDNSTMLLLLLAGGGSQAQTVQGQLPGYARSQLSIAQEDGAVVETVDTDSWGNFSSP